MTNMSPIDLDLRGLKCPLPVLRARKAMARLTIGQCLVVRCTDPLSLIDVPHFAQEDGHRIEHQVVVDGIAVFHIVKGPSTFVSSP
jgi:tRNA 2-thiouridine synthesizing protein A